MIKQALPKLRDAFSFTLTRGDDADDAQDAAVDAISKMYDLDTSIQMGALLRVRVSPALTDEQAFLITKMFSDPLAMEPQSVAKMVIDFNKTE